MALKGSAVRIRLAPFSVRFLYIRTLNVAIRKLMSFIDVFIEFIRDSQIDVVYGQKIAIRKLMSFVEILG